MMTLRHSWPSCGHHARNNPAGSQRPTRHRNGGRALRSGHGSGFERRQARIAAVCSNRSVNLVDRLLSHPDDRRALVSGDSTWTYGEIRDRADRWRGAMVAAGIGGGDRVVVVNGNDENFVLAQLAVIGLGAMLVPLNPQSPPAELGRELEMVQPMAALVSQASIGSWNETIERHAGSVGPIRVLEPIHLDDGPPAPVVSVEPDAPAALLHTSGTAGMPKPAVLTHGNLDASLRSVASLPFDLSATDHVALAVIPLFHVFGFNTIINLGLSIGACIVLEDYRGPERLAELVESHEVTLLGGPPTLWQALAATPGLDRERFSSVSLALSGAAKLNPATSVEIAEQFGVEIDEGYGLTETCAMVSSSVGTEAPVGSVGQLLPGFEARLVDGSGSDALVGDPGELWLRGPMISPGYFVATSPSGSWTVEAGSDDGWLRTGDIAIVDDDGNLAIVDRVKDIVIVSGFNVYPGEVEAALRSHPDVADAGVTGEEDPVTGEAIVAHVVSRPGVTIDVEELIVYCRSQLARYKVPSRVEIRADLPIGAVGKLRRREL